MTRTVNIIGAGPGGLAAAMLLAREGVRVRMLEKATVPGGRTSTIQTPDQPDAPGGFRAPRGTVLERSHYRTRVRWRKHRSRRTLPRTSRTRIGIDSELAP